MAADHGIAVPGDRRDDLVEGVVDQAFGTAAEAAGANVLTELARKTAYRGVVEPLTRWKRVATIKSAGDILLYQAHGEGIRGCVRHAISAVGDDNVVLLAHSLGGIIAFDLLAEPRVAMAGPDPLAKVRMLITVGSQVPLFYEIGALASKVSEATGLPGHFQVPWVNVYDRHDQLAYAGRGLFGDHVCRDQPINTRTPFPTAHSAYWAKPELYKILIAEMGRVGL
jgi:pimeloyl-ACP methyl ester carboxylesterase